MRAGFSFCGVDIGTLGLEYAPELEDVYVYKPSTPRIHEETWDGHDGGYFYGSSLEPKEFKLKCIFEEKQIDRGIMTRIYALFKRGRSGKLVFTRREWCYYYATVTEVDDSGLTNYLNGIIVITMKAYYPYARCDFFIHPRAQKYHEDVMLNSAIFDLDGMMPQFEYTNLTTTNAHPIELYLPNPGTERAKVSIAIAGDVGSGVTIKNVTTNTSCGFVAMSKAITTNANKYVFTDGISGKTMLIGPTANNIANGFLYHNQGFLEMEPCFPALRDIYISYVNNTITVSNILKENVIGKFIFAGDEWHRIVSQEDHTLTVTGLSGEGVLKTMIVDMNKIVIQPATTMDLSLLRFEYKPTFA